MNFTDFYQKYQQLRAAFPKPPTYSSDLEHSDFVSYGYRLKNCYFCFDTVDSQNCLYCFDSVRSVDCVDCDYVVDSELLYECNDAYKCYNCAYLDYCARLYDSFYCWDCFDSHDLFGCVHLKHKQYCLYNKQYTKEEYFDRIAILLKEPSSVHLAQIKKLSQLYPIGPTYVSHSENCDFGNQVHYCKNCYLCFDVARSEDCAYMYDTFYSKSSYDQTYGYKVELSYECTGCVRIYNCDYCDYSADCYDSAYLDNCKDCHNCFGCVGLAHKRFCILNKQYPEEEYRKLVDGIKSTAR